MDAIIEKATNWFKAKITSVAATAVAVIMVLSNLILPSWLDWAVIPIVTGIVILVGKLHGGIEYRKK